MITGDDWSVLFWLLAVIAALGILAAAIEDIAERRRK